MTEDVRIEVLQLRTGSHGGSGTAATATAHVHAESSAADATTAVGALSVADHSATTASASAVPKAEGALKHKVLNTGIEDEADEEDEGTDAFHHLAKPPSFIVSCAASAKTQRVLPSNLHECYFRS